MLHIYVDMLTTSSMLPQTDSNLQNAHTYHRH